MKVKYLFALLASAALFSLSACDEKAEQDDPENNEPEKPVAAQLAVLSGFDPVIDDAGGSFTVTFTSNLAWSAKAAATWVSITPSSGEAGERTTVTVTVTENRTYDERSSSITLSCGEGDNVASATVNFTQKQKGALILTDSTYPVGSQGGVITINLKTTSAITATVSDAAKDWIVPLGTKSLDDASLQFEVLPNTDYDAREGEIIFANETNSDKVTVVQSPAGALIVSPTKFDDVPAAGDVISITVKANSAVTPKVEGEAQGWISLIETRGLEENVFQFQVAENSGYDPREGVISFTNEAGYETVTVAQAATAALILSSTSVAVAPEGQVISISVKANSAVTAVVADAAKDWIIPVGTKGLEESVFQFEVLANEGADAREGVITFSNEAGSQTVTVTQAAEDALMVDPTSVQASAAGEVIELTVYSNKEVTVAVQESGEGWIVPVETRAKATVYAFEVLANESHDAREGVISFTSTSGEVLVTVSQEGKPLSSAVVDIAAAADLVALAEQFNALAYEGIEILEVNLLNDISFDASSSAAFNATGGIGTRGDGENTNYFNGTFNGGGHSISGLAATVPVFAYVGSEGSIKDLNIDASCSFTFTHPGIDNDAYLAPVAGYLKGAVENVKVHADVTMAAGQDITGYTMVGGIVGRATTGTVAACSYDGNITFPADYATAGKLFIGGLVGGMTNVGSVSASGFDGTICNEAKVYSDVKDPHLAIGGIVGFNGAGSVVSCTTSDHPTVEGAYQNTLGTIVNKTIVSYCTAVGGIVGENAGEVAQCHNGAQVLNTLFKEDNDNAKGRYLRVGGIVGQNLAEAKVTDCVNEAQLIVRSNPRLHSIGGVIGWNGENATVQGCSNKGALSIGTAGTGSYSARLPYFGGVIGENYSSNLMSLENFGDMLISRTENSTGVDARMGGVIGSNFAPIDGNRTIINHAQVYYNCNISSQAIKYCVGGVVGYTEASLAGLINEGYVWFNWNSDANVASNVYLGGVVGLLCGNGSIERCFNNGSSEGTGGEVNFAVKKGAAGHTNNKVGGILGGVMERVVDTETTIPAGATISTCENSGYVHGGNTNKVNGKTLYMGGIAGYLMGESSVTDCINYGKLLNDQFNNTITKEGATFEGGIVGFAQGSAEAPIRFYNVTNTIMGIGPRRGYGGGIVGYAEYAEISKALVRGDITGGSGYFLAGIAGWAVGSKLHDCSYFGSAIQSTQMQQGGGIVAKLDAGSAIMDCSSHVTTIDQNGVAVPYGAIAATSVEGTLISGCHYKNGVQICSDANFTDGGGNAADL